MTIIIEIVRVIPTTILLSLALAVIFFAFSIAKFARYEQESLKTLVARHPVLRFGPKLLSPKGFSLLLGTVEMVTGLLLVLGIFFPVLGFVGGVLGTLTFLVTLSLLPFVQYFEAEAGRMFLSSRGQFLMKDIGLLAACLSIAHYHALQLL